MEKLKREHLAGYMPTPTVEQLAEALENVGSFHEMSAELIAPELLANLLGSAILPVGVPDGETWQTVVLFAHELADMVIKGDAPEHCKRTARMLMNEFHRAPTVKNSLSVAAPSAPAAEPVQCEKCHGQGEVFSGQMQHFPEWQMQPPEPIMDACPECGGDSSTPAAEPAQCETVGCIDGIAEPGWKHCKRHQFYALREPAASLPAAGVEDGPDITTKHGYPAYSVAQHERIVAALSAQQSAPERVSVPECKLGILGRAYDAPSVCRAYTYQDQPHSDHAWKLGKAAAAVKAGGDWIDTGLSLLEQLQENGFGVFELRALLASHAKTGKTNP